MFNLATLFVDIKADQGQLTNALSGVRGQLTQANVAVGTFVGNLATMAVRGAAALGSGLFSSTIGSASSLNESISKTQTIFGQASGTIIGQADEMAKTFGLPKQAMLDAAGVMGLMAKGAGQSSAASADFGNSMTKLAADAMSFYNVPFDVALQKIQSGLSGESEPLRAFGVFLTEAAVAEEAAAMGAQKVNGNFSEGAKIAARASLITKGLADANGDLERTFSGTENQTRAFWGTLTNLGQSVGTILLPAFNALLNVGSAMAMSLAAGFEANRGTFEGWVAAVTAGVETVGLVWRNLGDIWQIVTLTAGAGIENFTAQVSALGQNVVQIAAYIGQNWYQLITDGLTAVGTGFENFAANLGNLGEAVINFLTNPAGGFKFEWTPLLEGFQATAAALPELIKPQLVNVDGQIAEIQDRMAGRELARMGGKAGAAGMTDAQMMAASMARTEGAAAEADKAGKFKSEIMGSAEFASKLRMANVGEDTPQKQLTELQQIREIEQKNGELMEKFLGGQMAVLG